MPDPQDRLVTPQAAAEAASKRFTRSEAVAAALSLAWLVAVAAYITFSPGEGGALGLVMTLLMVFLPIALIWIAVTTLRSVQDLRAEATRLQSAVEAMRSAYVQTQVQPSVEKKLEEIERATKSTETVLATFSSRRDVSLTQPSADRKAALASPGVVLMRATSPRWRWEPRPRICARRCRLPISSARCNSPKAPKTRMVSAPCVWRWRIAPWPS
ncbi:hypothetical protein ACFSHQ_08925 [Gemmobacter lanyuensis]